MTNMLWSVSKPGIGCRHNCCNIKVHRFPWVRISSLISSNTPTSQHSSEGRCAGSANRQMLWRHFQSVHSSRVSRLWWFIDGECESSRWTGRQQGILAKCYHRRALQICVNVVDATWKLRSILLHHDPFRKISSNFSRFPVNNCSVFTPQTISISMLLRYSHHQIFVFIGSYYWINVNALNVNLHFSMQFAVIACCGTLIDTQLPLDVMWSIVMSERILWLFIKLFFTVRCLMFNRTANILLTMIDV